MPQLIQTTTFTTPLGDMLAGATAEGICLLDFADSPTLEVQLKKLSKSLGAELAPGQSVYFDTLKSQLEEYFSAKRKTFDLPLVLAGTPFQQKVWKALMAIPYGATRSYGEQAKAIDAHRAVRAVAKANGENHVAIVIPCHRVIGADGKLTGYSGGLWRKQFLLDHEKHNL